MQHARDDIYCSLVARRAVARAALHLGIADMTAEALDVLGDVLLEYVSRIGRTISHSVEASGRSSAHVNVLDALRATELCTTNAVTHVHIPVRGENSNNERQEIQDASWKGLAAFLFGPDWYMDDSSREGNHNLAESAGGGKVGPSAKARAGWNAPYPEEIPLFPVVQNPSLIANPHSLDREAALEQLHSIVIEKPDKDENDNGDRETQIPGPEKEDIPDSVFQTVTWGILKDDEDNNKRKRTTLGGEGTEEPLSKKSKKTELKTRTEHSRETSDSNEEPALFLPSYYPPMPRAETNYRTVVVDSQPVQSREISLKSDPLLVRSSLVQLDKHERTEYWGAIQSGPVVAAGMVEKDEVEQVQPQIIPLGRASGSRVSRILEGSMDTGP